MATTVSVRPSANPLHQSVSLDDPDQYYDGANDDTLCMEYLNEIAPSHKSQSKDRACHLHIDQQAIPPPGRSSTIATKSGMSPYLQKLPHSNFIQTILPPSSSSAQQQRRQRRRRRSTSASRTRDELLDSAYQPSNVDHLDLSSFFGFSNHSFNRPTSAPTRTGISSAKKKRARTLLHRSSSKGHAFRIIVYRNGDHEKSCCCKATSLNAILQYATEKLHMPSAARRLFDAHGQEIYRNEDVQSNQEYYVSSGENFKDPYKSIQIQSEYSLNSTWTMKGLQMDAEKPKSFTTKTLLSRRLDKQIKKSISLTIIENGYGHDDAVYHMLIDSVLKDNLEKFLEDCTKKLELTAHARKVFNYRGDEIESLRLFLKSDDCEMKTANDGITYGPVWLSKGERFRPTGAYIFLESRYKEFRVQLRKLRKEHRELMMIINERRKKKPMNHHETDEDEEEHFSSTEETDKEEEEKQKVNDTSAIQDKSLLSMNKKEMKEMKKALEEKMKETKDSMEVYQGKMQEIEQLKTAEETSGAKFAIKHIKEIDFKDKMVGKHPLCLFVHENGSYRSSDPKIYLNLRSLLWKRIPQTPIEYLLEYLQTSVEIFTRQRPKRVFDINGTEIKLLGQMKDKQHIFISYGEDYRPAFEPCLAIQLHSVDVYEKENRLSLIKTFRTEDELIGDREKRTAKQISATWRPAETIPDGTRTLKYETELNDDQKQAFDTKTLDDRINEHSTFITKDDKLIYPELKINKRIVLESRTKHTGDKPPPKKVFSDIDLQTWYYNKDRYIYSKQIPSLVLTVIPEQQIRITWRAEKLFEKHRKTENLDGYSVQLRGKTNEPSNHQIWLFTTDGYIVCEAYRDYALTSMATIIPADDENFMAEGIRMNEDDPFISFAGICPKCPSKSPFIHRQRWGIRQISGFTIGDWKYSKVANPMWHKMALTWPVDATGAMIPDLQWPLEGCLIPGVPPIKALKSTQAPVAFVPIRLQVLKNGERDFSKVFSVVGPDISNLILEPKPSASMYRRLRIPEPEKEQRAHRQIRRMADARQREIKLFLENCTTICNLPFAARRLFDIHGTELFDLTSIERDSYVYVTCGEQWIDPELTKAEQQRRLLLAYLSNDVRMIYFYCALRNPTEYAVATEQGLVENSRLILNKCALNAQQRKRVKEGESIEQVIEHEEPVEASANELEPSLNEVDQHLQIGRTAHDRSHQLIDKKFKEKFRWPWEKIANKSLNLEADDDDDAVVFGNDEQNLTESFIATAATLSLSKTPRKMPKSVSISMQKFRWEASGGYISCVDDSHLVFGVKEIEGKVVEVLLKRRNPDDIFQRWILLPANEEDNLGYQINLKKPFLIVSKARPTMVLTVLLPSATGNESSEVNISCVGCTVTLQQRRYEETGCANQKWEYDETLHLLFPFNSNQTDKEITAANRANICSYTVNYEALSQPGFVVSILNTSDQSEDVPVCLACAQAMRGKYRLVKIEPHIRFTCAIGKRLDLKFHGPFHCLNHKVDLTRDEAENTLFQRQDQLEQLRQEASVRNIARELAAAKPIQIVHLLAYRNGDGRTKPGQLLIGSSIVGILDQATHRLSLINAARRLYVVDGNVILTVEDLIQWAANFYKKSFAKLSKPPQQTNLLDKVELNTPLPPRNPDSQRRSSIDNQSEKTTFSAKLRDISPSKQRFQSLPKPSDLKRAIKPSSTKGGVDIDMDYLLKFPIEIWVSSGEPFVKPAEVDQRHNLRSNQREQRTPVEHDLEKEKHALRLMKGRRISAQSPGELIAQQNPDIPVVKQGHWTQKSYAELDKQDDVALLRTSLDEVRLSQQPEITRPVSSVATDRLAQHAKTKRVMVYLNGEAKETAAQCFGSNLNELMENAKLKCNLMQPIQALFTEHGELIERFDQLTRDQLVCVSTTKTFITSSERQRDVDIKANWARTRNKYGDQATDIRVNSNLATFPQSVDPFGPPLLTLNDQHQLRPTTKPPTAPAPMYRRLAIEQPAPAPTSAVLTEVTPSPNMMKDSLVLSEDENDEDDDGSDSEIERITNVKGDENESSRPITPRIGERVKSPFSQLFSTQPASTTAPRSVPSTNKSDSDENEFIAMLKRK